MAILTNERGFTYLSLISTLSILLILLPFLPFLYGSLPQDNSYDELAVRQFFYFLFDEFNTANDYTVTDSSITFSYLNNKEVIISQYNNLIRRQVAGRGHEILLRGVQQIIINELSYGVKVTITTIEGELYVKVYRAL